MNAGVIGYLNSKNIGDYVQTLSVINLINQGYTILERERLNNYKGKISFGEAVLKSGVCGVPRLLSARVSFQK